MKSWIKGKKKQEKWSKGDISKTDLKDDSDLNNQYLAQELQVESVPLSEQFEEGGKKRKSKKTKKTKTWDDNRDHNLEKVKIMEGKNNKAKVHPGCCVDQDSTDHLKDNTS